MADDAAVVLAVEHLSKTYRVFSRPHHRLLQARADRRGTGRSYCFEVPAVDDVSFELRRGEAVAIIGRNGSGKSTLLSMIAGTLAPTRGAVRVDGRVSALLELGTGFNPDFSGRQNVRINAAILGLTETEIDRIEPLVEAFAEIGPFIDEPVRTYSSGMYVRLAFATAVHVVPDLLIVDEALAVGDVFFQQKCYEYLTTELADATKLIVTHDLASAVRLADRCIVMERGRPVFDGPPLEAVELYTALHLGDRGAPGGSGGPSGSRSGSAAPGATAVDAPGAVDEGAGREGGDGAAVSDDAMASVDRVTSTDANRLDVLRFGCSRRSGAARSPLVGESLVVTPGDQLALRFDVRLGVAVREPIWGYLVRDRVGNALFGQNTVGSGLLVEAVEAGTYVVELELTWPEVAPGEYVLTFGVGDGLHPLHHSIVAWAQSVAKFTCVTSRAVHGAFNNDLSAARVRPIEGKLEAAPSVPGRVGGRVEP